jgi:hypothetical protein
MVRGKGGGRGAQAGSLVRILPLEM